MKTQKLLKIMRLCHPAISVALCWSTTSYAQQGAASHSCVVLDKSQPAQSGAGPSMSIGESPKPKRFSWNAQPLPKCKAFLITDFGVSYNLLPAKYSEPGENMYFSGDLGFMVNQNERSARGLTLSFGATGFGQGTTLRGGVKARFRRWLGQKSSLDLSPGLVCNLWSDGSLRTPGAFGISGQIGINYSWVGLTGLLEVIPGGRTEYSYSYDPSRGFQDQSEKKTDVSFYTGIRMGGWQGTTVAAVGGALAAIAIALSSMDFGFGGGDWGFGI